MNEIQKRINTALQLLSALSVSGNAVDVIAAVKAHLRDAAELAKDRSEAKTDG